MYDLFRKINILLQVLLTFLTRLMNCFQNKLCMEYNGMGSEVPSCLCSEHFDTLFFNFKTLLSDFLIHY